MKVGMAWVYPQFCRIKEVCGPLRELEQEARAEKRGL